MRILLRGGYVHTPADPHATALCVEDDAIVWTGDDDASAHFEDGADRVVELEGRLVTPAFVDSHVHLSQTGIAASSIDFSDVSSLAEALDALAAHARTAALPVVLGLNWDDTRWPEGRPFTREEVDRAVDGRVAYLARVDAHSAVVSSAFVDRLPSVVAADGWTPDGLVSRAANIEAREAVFAMLPGSAHEDAIARALVDAAAAGIGMVHENGAPGDSPAEDFERIATVAAAHPGLPEVVGYWGDARRHRAGPRARLPRSRGGPLHGRRGRVAHGRDARCPTPTTPPAATSTSPPTTSPGTSWPAPRPVSRPAST